MIPLLTITHLLNGLLMIVLPAALGIFLTRRFHLGWRIWWIGAGTFVLSQVGHIPFNYVLTLLFQRGVLPAPPAEWQLPFNALVLGLSAGLWEEWFRYIAYRWWAREARDWKSGLLLGAGHGGAEAIILGILVLLALVNMSIARGMDLSTQVPAEQLALAQQQVQAYWSAEWYETLIGALERAFAILFHLSASLLVLQAFIRKNIAWVWLSVGWHTLINAAAVYTINAGNMYLTELLIGILSTAGLSITLLTLRRGLPENDSQPPEEPEVPSPLVPPLPADLPETPKNLEDTRYN
ncbi:MAG: YhfC family intramembrane metalloprotease [Anaerolineales bacterium]|nr:YhfC family intramembrane metalloprotease [Anaerolineales bacterium]